jgi:hypothetical protein
MTCSPAAATRSMREIERAQDRDLDDSDAEDLEIDKPTILMTLVQDNAKRSGGKPPARLRRHHTAQDLSSILTEARSLADEEKRRALHFDSVAARCSGVKTAVAAGTALQVLEQDKARRLACISGSAAAAADAEVPLTDSDPVADRGLL